MIDKWNKRFLDMAALVATWSKDPATQVGAVIVDAQSRIISTGFNGLAQNVHDLPSRYENKHVKHQIILHAESNAILFARQSLTGCTIYTAPLATCAHCASQIIQTGIANLIFAAKIRLAKSGNNLLFWQDRCMKKLALFLRNWRLEIRDGVNCDYCGVDSSWVSRVR